MRSPSKTHAPGNDPSWERSQLDAPSGRARNTRFVGSIRVGADNDSDPRTIDPGPRPNYNYPPPSAIGESMLAPPWDGVDRM